MAEQKHFVLVHGACHGGWCWYKVKPRLQAAGHRVTVLDLTASGVNMVKSITDVETVEEYSQPLMEIMASLDADDHKVILVGHSLGGLNIALAMEKYPERIEVAVFLTAFAPDTVHEPSHVLDQFVERMPMEAWLDTEFSTYGSNSDEPKTAIFFGPKFLAKLYHLSPPENLELALSLTRPSSLFREDLSKAKKFSNEGYGSVRKVFVICKEDQGIPEQFQRWTIENGGFENVMAIEDADHMPMFSKPNQLCECLVDIARF